MIRIICVLDKSLKICNYIVIMTLLCKYTTFWTLEFVVIAVYSKLMNDHSVIPKGFNFDMYNKHNCR